MEPLNQAHRSGGNTGSAATLAFGRMRSLHSLQNRSSGLRDFSAGAGAPKASRTSMLPPK